MSRRRSRDRTASDRNSSVDMIPKYRSFRFRVKHRILNLPRLMPIMIMGPGNVNVLVRRRRITRRGLGRGSRTKVLRVLILMRPRGSGTGLMLTFPQILM